MNKKSIDKIASFINHYDTENSVDWPFIKEAMNLDDLELQGVIFHFFHSRPKETSNNIDFVSYFNFCLNYFKKCLISNPTGEWSDNRYEAGWSMASWIKGIWTSLDEKYKTTIAASIADIYLTHEDLSLRTCIENAVLEHIFESREIREFFYEWKKNKSLNKAYRNAILWGKYGGNSPL